MKYKIHAGVIGGRIPDDVAKAIGRKIREFEGKQIRIEISEYMGKRSNAQCRFLFGVIYPLIKDYLRENGANLDIDEIHDWTVTKVWKHTEPIILPDGDVYIKRLSSADLPKDKLEENITLTRIYWAERGLALPLPNEVDFNH